MKTLFLFTVVFIGLGLPQVSVIAGASCEGTKYCGNNKWVDCELAIPPSGYCKIQDLPNGVRCISQNQERETVDTKTVLCEEDGGNSAGCDPGQPLYWLYCDPFAI